MLRYLSLPVTLHRAFKMFPGPKKSQQGNSETITQHTGSSMKLGWQCLRHGRRDETCKPGSIGCTTVHLVRLQRKMQPVPRLPKTTFYYHQPGGHFEINFPAHLIDRILHATALHWKAKPLEAAGPLSGHGWHCTKQLGGRGRVSPVGLWWCWWLFFSGL